LEPTIAYPHLGLCRFAACFRKGALVNKKTVLASGLLLISAAGHAAPGSDGPFLGLSGSWSGAGTITMTNGATERIRCKATYAVNATGKAVQQTLRCASDSYRAVARNGPMRQSL
jgi:hypothetical protein